MKKISIFLMCILLTLSMVGCGKNTYRIGILIPTENSSDFLWADEEISPKGRRIIVTASDEFSDVEFQLKPIEAKEENTYESIIIEPGQSVAINVEKDAWFKIGMHMLNNAVPGKVKYFEIKGVSVRIASKDDKISELPDAESNVLQGRILEIGNGTMLIAPILDDYDKLEVPITNMPASPEPKVGDIVEITYDCSIEENDPTSLGNITHVEVVGATVGGDTCPRVTINGITYYDRGTNPLKAGLPPADFSVYEEAEIPVEGALSATATAYAVCDDVAYLLINDEWYEFVPEICDGVPLAPEGFSKP